MAGARRGVCPALPSYAAAVATLSAGAHQVQGIAGAVAVVPGAGDWWQGVLSAREQGAVAVVVAGPGMLPPGTIDAGAGSIGIPVVLARSGLRPDIVSDALLARKGSPPRIITVEIAAPAGELDGLVCDAFGWIRSLAQGPVALRSARSSGPGRMALLECAPPCGGATPATLVATVLDAPGARGFMKLVAIGEVRTEVVIDPAAGLERVETSTPDGVLVAPRRYETQERLALRRVLAALSSAEPLGDLGGMVRDMMLLRDLQHAGH